MRSRARVVADPDTEVLDLLWALLMDLHFDLGISRCLFHALMHIPKYGRRTMLIATTSPFDFLTFRSFIKKYQNLDLATTVLGANMRMR